MARKYSPFFWTTDYYFWEWILKNDLAYLTSEQAIERMRNNAHLLKKHQILIRSVKKRLKILFNRNGLKSQTFIIKS